MHIIKIVSASHKVKSLGMPYTHPPVVLGLTVNLVSPLVTIVYGGAPGKERENSLIKRWICKELILTGGWGKLKLAYYMS